MTSSKKPDNVVFNSETQKYDAAIKPYATSLGAPVIIPTDTVAWKNRSINKINHKVTAKFLELKAEYENMIQEFEYNKLIYNSKFSFEPIIGELFFHLFHQNNVTLIRWVVFI
jgi:hypothetical protein